MHDPVTAVRPAPAPGRVGRVAFLSVHTCPLDQPGTGDSGGMNVLIRSVARRLGEMGLAVDIFTRRACFEHGVVAMDPGVRVIHLNAGPAETLPKNELIEHLPEFLCSLLTFGSQEAETLGRDGAPYDLIHSHYWLSGWVGRKVRERWGVPLVQSFHTLGRVKDLAGGEVPEALERICGEQRVVDTADRLLVGAPQEATDLLHLYDARPERVRVVSAGVDTRLFTPGDAAEARRELGLPPGPLVLFVGRLQPLKGPDVAVRSLAALAAARPGLDVRLAVVGGPSGPKGMQPDDLAKIAADGGVSDRLLLVPPVPHEQLPLWYRAADVVIVPSRSESFGLVALEASACGTPVVASDAGGLRTTVSDGVSGILVSGDDPERFASPLARLLEDPALRREMGCAGARFARRFDWLQAASNLLEVYEEVAAAPHPAAGA